MMRYLIFSLLVLLTACNKNIVPGSRQLPIPNKIVKQHYEVVLDAQLYNFLEGRWIRINDDEGFQTYENWKRKSPVEYTGNSYTTSDNKIVWEEESSLKVMQDKVVLRIKLAPMKYVNFYCSKIYDKEDICCVNTKNDYPKKIEYWMQNDTLNAKISGGGPDVSFVYIRNRSPE